jgi:hypothetical protein
VEHCQYCVRFVLLGSCKRGEVRQAACLPSEQPAGRGEVMPWRPLCASALERRARSRSMRYVLPRWGKKDIWGGGWYGVHDSVSGYRSKEMAVCECCHHTALGPGCSPTVLTYLPSHPGHSGFCALSVSGTLPQTSKCPTGRKWEGVGWPRGGSSSHTQDA